MRIQVLLFIVLALVLAQTSFGATVAGSGGTISSCSNLEPPADPSYPYFDCSLYNDVMSYSFDLTPLMEDGGAALSDNLVGAGYFIVSRDPGQLFDESYWQTVLYFPGDQGSGLLSDTLDVYWLGAFPLASVAQNTDQTIVDYYNNLPGGAGSASISDFFMQASTGSETVYLGRDTYDIYTPEPGTIALLGSGLALLGGAFLKRRRTAGRAA